MPRKHIKTLHKQIALLEKQIEELIAEDDETVVEHISSVPGVGKKTAIALLTATKGMHGFDGYRQVSSYFGLCPRIYDSGKSVHGKAHICKMGMGWIRKLLYMWPFQLHGTTGSAHLFTNGCAKKEKLSKSL
ncbi:MAG: hypothetical protein E7087_05830 [Bacteroidales bacterium]|nr:hypothetical protein [Bacteroidales bacterium]